MSGVLSQLGNRHFGRRFLRRAVQVKTILAGGIADSTYSSETSIWTSAVFFNP